MNDVFNCIRRLLPPGQNPETAFAEGNLPRLYSGSRDMAVLRNENAELFAEILRSHCGLFGIPEESVVLQRSVIYRDEVKYRHSCYPKNLHRWLTGTISRKRLCRAEFVVLTYCWAIQWQRTGEAASPAAGELLDICRKYDSRLTGGDGLPEALWRACESAYKSRR